MTRLEKWQAWATIVNAFLVALLAVVGVGIQRAIATESTQQRYVELATQILRERPNKENRALRQWAARILQVHSPVPLDDKLRDSLGAGMLKLPNDERYAGDDVYQPDVNESDSTQ